MFSKILAKNRSAVKDDRAPILVFPEVCSGLIDLKIGWENGAAVSVEFNRQTNNYLAVTGKPESGK